MSSESEEITIKGSSDSPSWLVRKGDTVQKRNLVNHPISNFDLEQRAGERITQLYKRTKLNQKVFGLLPNIQTRPIVRNWRIWRQIEKEYIDALTFDKWFVENVGLPDGYQQIVNVLLEVAKHQDVCLSLGFVNLDVKARDILMPTGVPLWFDFDIIQFEDDEINADQLSELGVVTYSNFMIHTLYQLRLASSDRQLVELINSTINDAQNYSEGSSTTLAFAYHYLNPLLEYLETADTITSQV